LEWARAFEVDKVKLSRNNSVIDAKIKDQTILLNKTKVKFLETL
jgi:hypothetical protein